MEEVDDLTPQYMGCTKAKFRNFISETNNSAKPPLNDVFHTEHESVNETRLENPSNFQASRFILRISQLVKFFTSPFCRLDPGYNQLSTYCRDKKFVITPNGTWESIVAWARNAKLDTMQEVAFHILAATYVLTFMDEAEDDCSGEIKAAFIRNKTILQLLARKHRINSGPIRTFISSPAGAGKGKFKNKRHE